LKGFLVGGFTGAYVAQNYDIIDVKELGYRVLDKIRELDNEFRKNK
jgi:hypothetical protein